MQIVNLTEKDIFNGLKSPEIYGKYWGDYYRKFTDYDMNNILGLYHKSLLYSNPEELDYIIKTEKSCWNQEYTWEHYSMCRLFTLISRLEEAYEDYIKTDSSYELKSPVITGIALYKNYPVGTLFPRELLNYKNYGEMLNNQNLSENEKQTILLGIEHAIQALINKDIYPIGIIRDNILVNPNNFDDVRIDGLDGPLVSRVESKGYARTLKKRGRDLANDAWENYNKLR